MNILPLYLPHQGCKQACVYCNQPLIVGSRDEQNDWQQRLETISASRPDKEWEIAFYGGTFSALPLQDMDRCFGEVSAYAVAPNVRGIRISTRPDAVPEAILLYLKERGVQTIELGVESMDDSVLIRSGRGHTAEEVREACARIRNFGFILGIHLMCGLPGQSRTSWEETVEETLRLQPALVRIAPTLVLKDTPLERLYRRGRYTPLTLEEAIEQCGYAYAAFHRQGIAIARVGLALSDRNGDGADKVVAGPWHPALRHEVESRLAGETILNRLAREKSSVITVNPRDYSVTVGSGRCNVSRWEQCTGLTIRIERDAQLPRHWVRIGGRMPVPLFYTIHE